eukprot:5513771-Prymnesium_polylepis.5
MPGDKQPSLAKRTEAFVRQVVMPACAHMLDPAAPLQDRLTTKYVRAVFQAWDTQLRDIFGCYSKADRRTVAAERHLTELNVSEVAPVSNQTPTKYAPSSRWSQIVRMSHSLLPLSPCGQFLFMLADGNLLSGGFSTRTAAAIFEQVCTLYQGDQTEQEMLFPEFLTTLARLCDMKQTEADRQAEDYSFELSLADWLSGFFVPTYSKIVRQKQRGNNKATL